MRSPVNGPLTAVIVIAVVATTLYLHDSRRGLVVVDVAPSQRALSLTVTPEARRKAAEHRQHYVLCDNMQIVFGMLAGPRYISTRVLSSLRSYLASETTVVYLENKVDERVQMRVKKYLTHNPQLKHVRFWVAFLEKSEEERALGTVTGAWKNLPLLHDLWRRFNASGVDWFITIDDDTFVVTHNMRVHLSTFYTGLELQRGCRGWARYAAYRASIAGTNATTSSSVSTHLGGAKLPGAYSWPDHFARSQLSPTGLDPEEPHYTGRTTFVDDSAVNASANDVFNGIKINVVHGGGGIWMSRVAMQRVMTDFTGLCLSRCKQPGAGDLRVACCVRNANVSATNDEHFTILPMLRALGFRHMTPTRSYPVSFHASRLNHSLALDAHHAFTRIVASCSNSSLRCALMAERGGWGRDAPAPAPIFWDSMEEAFAQEPLASRYPRDKYWSFGQASNVKEAVDEE